MTSPKLPSQSSDHLASDPFLKKNPYHGSSLYIAEFSGEEIDVTN